MDLSIVIPVYNEKDNLGPLLAEISEVLRPTGMEFEVICVDDGSRDGSQQLLRKLVTEHDFLRVVFFRRNSGQTAAFDAGFRHASGKVVATMDADMQNDPRDLPKLMAALDEDDGYDVVTGWRKDRKDGVFLRKIPSKIANAFIRFVTKTRVHDLGCSIKVYRHEITSELRLYGEMHRFLTVLAEMQGARVAERVVNHRARHAGASKYGLSRTIKVLLDLLTVWFIRGYQTKPIYLFGGVGALMFGVSAVSALVVLYEKFAMDVWVHRNPLFLIAMFCGLIGVQFLGMGLLAEMTVRTYFESQNKPSYPIRELLGFQPKPAAPFGSSSSARPEA